MEYNYELIDYEKEKNFIVDPAIYYRVHPTSLGLNSFYFDGHTTIQQMRINYPQMTFYRRVAKKRFKTDKPYPWGY